MSAALWEGVLALYNDDQLEAAFALAIAAGRTARDVSPRRIRVVGVLAKRILQDPAADALWRQTVRTFSRGDGL